jgi:signal transduction histidine kinase/CheY-like chemotaxis protein
MIHIPQQQVQNPMTDTLETPMVLIVEDHLPAAEMLTRLLTNNHYRVTCVNNGDEAIVQAQKLLPDLILLDVMMPGKSGFDVLSILRQHARTADIPAILITALDDPSDIEQGLNLGADDFMTKPIEARELLARARSKIEAYHLRQALQRRTRDMEALLRVASELNHHLQVDDLQHLLLYLLLDLLPGDASVIISLDEHGEIAGHLANWRSGDASDLMLDANRLLEEVRDNDGNLRWSKDKDSPIPGFGSGMAMMLEQSNRQLGILLLLSQTFYDDYHQQIFTGISRQAALALRNAELYEFQVQYAENLEQMVEDRTAELRSTQNMLLRSEKLASVGRFARGIAHEINNPLNPILLLLESISEDIQSGNEIDPRDIQEMLHSARRISRTVDRLLQFTRKQSEAQPDVEQLHIANVLENVIALSQKFFQQDGISIFTELDPLPVIYGNRDQLEQVFLNLMLNAKDAMKRGGVLTIQSFTHENQVIVRFKDTGSGIPPEIIDKIFEPFTSGKETGNGLGLFISYGIVQNHNGTIDVTSKRGEGTLFTLTFPMVENRQS